MMRRTSTAATVVTLRRLRLRFRFLHSARWRRPCFRRKILPVPVILKRFATPFRVLLRATFFLIEGGEFKGLCPPGKQYFHFPLRPCLCPALGIDFPSHLSDPIPHRYTP